MDAHSTRSPPLALALIAAATAFGLAACGGVAPKTATTVNPCATPGAGLPTLVCNLGTAHTYQDLAAYADAGFMHQGYSPFAGTGGFVTRDPNTLTPIITSVAVNGTPTTGTYNTTSGPPEHLYAFNLPGKTTVKVSLDPGTTGAGWFPFPAQQFSTQGAKLFNKATGAYYADLVQGTYNPKTGGEFYVLTLPGGDYVVAVTDCPGGCPYSAPATSYTQNFTLAVSPTSATPNLLFPGATPAGVQYMPAFGTADQFYISFAFTPLSFTGSPFPMTSGPFGIPAVKVDPVTGHWLLYGDQQAFSAIVTVLNNVGQPSTLSSTQLSVDVHGAGVASGTISVSATELTITGGIDSTSTSITANSSPSPNLAAFSSYNPDWTNVGVISFIATDYHGTITVGVVVTPTPSGGQPPSLVISLPGTLPMGGSITLSCGAAGSVCASHTATLDWSGWTMPTVGKQIVQQLSVVGAESPLIGTVDGTVSASGSISTTESIIPAAILGQRFESEQIGDHVILQGGKTGAYCGPPLCTSAAPYPPIIVP